SELSTSVQFYLRENPMKVDIWSDVYCPWCYLGKRRLEKALVEFDHRDQVEVVWHSFQLDPDAPKRSPGKLNDLLARKMGRSLKEVETMQARLTAFAA